MHLIIELKSPLCAGSGIGRPGYVDRDVIFDRAGLPVIPGRRIKGLLRDGYRQVLQTPLGADLPTLEELFGEAGTRTGEITVTDAQVPDADRLREWLLGVYRNLPLTLGREDVIAAFTEIRRQTAMSRLTGAPAENTLRATRVIRSGLRFVSQIGGVDGDRARLAITYASQAVQFMGTSRTRGLGWVQCSLSNEACGVATNLPAQNSTRKVFKSQNDALCFSLTLESAALFPGLGSDANTVLTQPSIPGSALQGLFAQRYLQQHKQHTGGQADDGFYELFCSGRLVFLSATVELRNAQSRRRSVPVPLSVRTSKRDHTETWNLATTDPGKALRRTGGWTVLEEICRGREAVIAEPATQLHYHHARAADPRFGRALGEQAASVGLAPNENEGTLFTYESLAPGQIFIGEILGPPDLLARVRALISDGESVGLGRSRGSQYGGAARWRWEDAAQTETINYGSLDSSLLVTLLSPMLSLNRWGHPAPEFPHEQLAEALGGGATLKLQQAFTRMHWQGGYLSHQRLPRLQIPALAAGSVLIYKVEQVGDPSAISMRLASASARGYGLRQEEGFGRIDVRWKVSVSDRPLVQRYKEPQKHTELRTVAGSAEWKLARDVLRERLIAAADAEGMARADCIPSEALNRITPHLLHRLLMIFSGTPVEEIPSVLQSKLAEGPRRALQRLIFQDGEKTEDLLSFLSRSWKVFWQELTAFCDEPRNGWVELLDSNPFAQAADRPPDHEDGKFARSLFRRCIRSFLTEIAWRKKSLARNVLAAVAGEQS
ncbi:MAG TPA: RAMP superfamily CRISPR-associated protein [Candidatus Angelobacter sp.]|nr:RAMP superfamily CRISPR-associated protein [Candidatus Angelobacter sp.]